MKRKYLSELKGFETFKGYSISSDGKVYTHIKRHGKKWVLLSEPKKELKQSLNKKGYPTVRLANQNQKKSARVHRLVALAFLPNPCNKPEVNHIDGNKQNNQVENLEWVTGAENHKHKVENNLNVVKSGAEHYMRLRNYQEGDHHCCKKVLQIDDNGNIVAEYKSISLASKEIGIGYTNISKAIHGHIKKAGGYVWNLSCEGSTTILMSRSSHKRGEMGNSCTTQDEDIV